MVNYYIKQVWITQDNELAVIHGGYDGQMPLKIGEPANTEPTMIFDLTLAEARNHFSQTPEYLRSFDFTPEALFTSDNTLFQIPTLDQVVAVLDRQVLINIEIKTPREDSLKPTYDSVRLVDILHSKL